MLNSHMDVVPVFEDKWTYKPFSAHMDEQGNIYARGAQDMKSVGIQYLEAIRWLMSKGVTLRRTLHVTFVPDEEIGGKDGMAVFVKTNLFKNLNVCFALDEGMASETDVFALYYGERSIWQVMFYCPGHTGHGSLLLENTPGEKVAYLLKKIYEFRKTQQDKLTDNPDMTLGDVTTVNVTKLNGGVQNNVIPPEFTFVMDSRIALSVDLQKYEEMLNRWCQEAGQGVHFKVDKKQMHIPATKLDATNPFWMAFKEVTDRLGLKLKPQVFPGGTDSRYLRAVGIPALGFSPINNTPILLHDNDEFLNRCTFVRGIRYYCDILQQVAEVEERSG
ncbi:unnamed protein product [Acanthoscelides obtectus]|nr:unnamed protein product [Acanthoscelides obtectus]CAK1644951.1 Aminoacylase-1 [Acanthoscelides obtectus]